MLARPLPSLRIAGAPSSFPALPSYAMGSTQVAIFLSETFVALQEAGGSAENWFVAG
jgi:hypothetical protein